MITREHTIAKYKEQFHDTPEPCPDPRKPVDSLLLGNSSDNACQRNDNASVLLVRKQTTQLLEANAKERLAIEYSKLEGH